MLKVMIEELLSSLRSKLESRREVEHDVLCVELADQFELWDADNCFPTWLSRVVEGELNDWQNDEGWWYKGSSRAQREHAEDRRWESHHAYAPTEAKSLSPFVGGLAKN